MTYSCIKLTDEHKQTRGRCQWIEKKWLGKPVNPLYRPPMTLCSSDVFHAYPTLNLARFFVNYHLNYPTIRAWEAEYDTFGVCDGIKLGSPRMRIIKEIPWHPLSYIQRYQWMVGLIANEYTLGNAGAISRPCRTLARWLRSRCTSRNDVVRLDTDMSDYFGKVTIHGMVNTDEIFLNISYFEISRCLDVVSQESLTETATRLEEIVHRLERE